MTLNFSEIDLESIIDEVETATHVGMKMRPTGEDRGTYRSQRDFLKEYGEPISSDDDRVTASGFTETTLRATSRVAPLTHKRLGERLSLARDLSRTMRVLELEPDQAEYVDDMICRYSNKLANEDPPTVQLLDTQMLNTITAKSNLRMKEMKEQMFKDAQDVKADVKEMAKSLIGHLRSKPRRDSFDDNIETRTIVADDSVSQVLPLRRKVPPESKISIRSQYTEVSNRTGLTSSIIGGYNPSMVTIDDDDEVELKPIVGLPRVFVNDRLNFLCHLHKPLKALLTENGVYPCSDILMKLESFVKRHRGRDREPADNLLYMVIRDTFSISRMQVKHNNFDLPLLEVGMYMNSRLITMCIDQLNEEYSTQWFASMKDLDVPEFHSRYTKVRRVHSDPISSQKQRRGTRSVLGL